MKSLKNISFILFGIIVFLVVLMVVLLVSKDNTETVNYVVTKLSYTTTLLEETTVVDNTDSFKAIAAGIGIGLAALGGTIAMGWAVAKTSESISRQPEAEGKIRSSFMLGLVFIETLVIYALIVAILIIFVL